MSSWHRHFRSDVFSLRRRPNKPSSATRVRPLAIEMLEERRVLSTLGPVPELPGVELADSNPENLQGQVIYLDYDGEENVTYNGPVQIGPFDVPAFGAPGELAGHEDAIMTDVAEQLNELFAPVEVTFTLDRPEAPGTYSTVYVGGDGVWASEYGDNFLGLAEKVDVANLDPADNAFVFADPLAGVSVKSSYFAALKETVAHETSHLLGYAHLDGDAASSALNGVALADPSVSITGLDTPWVLGTMAMLDVSVENTGTSGGDYDIIILASVDDQFDISPTTTDHIIGTVEDVDLAPGDPWGFCPFVDLPDNLAEWNDSFIGVADVDVYFAAVARPNENPDGNYYGGFGWNHDLIRVNRPGLSSATVTIEGSAPPWTWGDEESIDFSVGNTGAGFGYYDVTLAASADEAFDITQDTNNHIIDEWSNIHIPAGHTWSQNNYSVSLPNDPANWGNMFVGVDDVYFYLFAMPGQKVDDTYYGGSGGDSHLIRVNSAATPPAVPSHLSATAVAPTQINLSWQDNSDNEDGFAIERKTNAGGSWSQIATVGANTTSYPNTGLTANNTYYYRVRAYNSAGESLFSSESSATTHDRFEPNDTRGTAANLGAMSGRVEESGLTIHSATDRDWFRFETLEPSTDAHYVDVLFGHAVGDLNARLYDATGNESRSGTSTTNNERLRLGGLQAGTYFLEVYGWDGGANGYDLAIVAPLSSSEQGNAPSQGIAFIEKLGERAGFSPIELDFVQHPQYGNVYTIDGVLSLGSTFGDTRLGFEEATLHISDGGWLAEGKVSIEKLELGGGWSVETASVDFRIGPDSDVKYVKGATTIEFPTKMSLAGMADSGEATVEIEFDNGGVQAVRFDVDELNRLITPKPPVYLQSIDGFLENINNRQELIAFGGAIGVTLGPEIEIEVFGNDVFSDSSLVRVNAGGTLNKEMLHVDGEVNVLGGLLTGSVDAKMNWHKGFLRGSSQVDVLSGLYRGDGGFVVTPGGDLTVEGKGAVSLPDWLPILGGQQLGSADGRLEFTNNGDYGDDSVAVWGKVPSDIPFWGGQAAGLRLDFTGNWSWLGGTEIDVFASLEAEAVGTLSQLQPMATSVARGFQIPDETSRLLLAGQWSEPHGDVAVRLVGPAGAVYEEASFDDHNFIEAIPGLSDDFRKTLAINNPAAGEWWLEFVSDDEIGEVTVDVLAGAAGPTIGITDVSRDAETEMATVEYTVAGLGDAGIVGLYYATSGATKGGIRFTTLEVSDDHEGSTQWDTSDLPPGEYYIYGMIEGNDSVPFVSAYSPAFDIASDNNEPAAFDREFTVTEGGVHSGVLAANDADGDELAFRLVGEPEHGSVIINLDGTFTYTSHVQESTDFSREDSFTFVANDGWIDSNVGTMSVTASRSRILDSTYVGGSSLDIVFRSVWGGFPHDGAGTAVDSTGNAFLASTTKSGDLPEAVNQYHGGSADAYLAKVSPEGQILWTKYLGGSNYDGAMSVAVDADDNVFVVGSTSSEDLAGAVNDFSGGWDDAFIAKLSGEGELMWLRFLGGSGEDEALDVAVDSAGDVLVTGWTDSDDFDAVNNSYSSGTGGDAFAAKVSSDGSLLWSTYIGSDDDEGGLTIAADPTGFFYVAGGTASNRLPRATNASFGGPYDGFVAKLSSDGNLVWTRYIGGSQEDSVFGIALGPSDVFVAGGTLSDDLVGANNAYLGGTADAFVARLSPDGTLLWSNYLGGEGEDGAFDVAVDPTGNVWTTGGTSSTGFSGSENDYQGGDYDGFVAVLEPTGDVSWSNYIGGDDEAAGFSIALVPSRALIAGGTYSDNLEGAFNPYNGGGDAFLARVDCRPCELQAEQERPSLEVTTAEDVFDLYDGQISLREAIWYAGQEELENTVTFAEDLDGSTITLAGASLWIGKSLTIDATALDSLTIDAAGHSRVFTLGPPEGETVELAALAVTGGSAAYGGGIYNFGTLTVTNSTLSGNSAKDGGGIHSRGTLTVRNSTIADNSAEDRGGGIHNRDGTLTVTTSTVSGNSADYGGGICGDGGGLTVVNTNLAGNLADFSGGGIYADRMGSKLTLRNSTIAGNLANRCGGICASNAEITNSIVCLNHGGERWYRINGQNNLIGIDPAFVRAPSAGADGNWGTDDDDLGDLRLTDASPAINAGNNELAVGAEGQPLTRDLEGNSRISDDTVDIGAYEYPGGPAAGRETPSLVVSAADDDFDLYDGEVTLREAIYYSHIGIGKGTVTFDASLDGATINLAGHELLIRDPLVIDASDLSTLTVDAGNESRVFTLLDDVTLAGLTVTGGVGDIGGGIYGFGTFSFINCTISGNSADRDGGGIYNDGTMALTNCTISGNSAARGGGTYNEGTLTVTNSTIAGNSAHGTGGILSEGPLTVTNSIVALNRSESGKNIYALWGEPEYDFNVIGVDPGFVVNPGPGPDETWETDDDVAGDFRLLVDSPAVDAGNNTLLPRDEQDLDDDGDTTDPLPIDLAGFRRIVNGTVDVGAHEYQLPNVQSVWVADDRWEGSFVDRVDARGAGNPNNRSNGALSTPGYYVPNGRDQLQTLPWNGIDTITIGFNKDVNITADDIHLYGVNTQEYPSTFVYDAETQTARLTLEAAIPVDKLLLVINDTATDLDGHALDGEWEDELSTLSGDGTAGGDFQFRFNVLPGDATNSGNVVAGDVSKLASAFGSFAGESGGGAYTPFVDFDGSGNVVAGDVSILASHFGQFLPSGDPVVPASSGTAADGAGITYVSGTAEASSVSDRSESDEVTLTEAGLGQHFIQQNPSTPSDVNNDGYVSPIDAQLVVHYLNDPGSARAAVSSVSSTRYCDVNGDGYVSPTDALHVIAYLNSEGSGRVDGEGEAVVTPQLVSEQRTETPQDVGIDDPVAEIASGIGCGEMVRNHVMVVSDVYSQSTILDRLGADEQRATGASPVTLTNRCLTDTSYTDGMEHDDDQKDFWREALSTVAKDMGTQDDHLEVPVRLIDAEKHGVGPITAPLSDQWNSTRIHENQRSVEFYFEQLDHEDEPLVDDDLLNAII